MADRIDNNPLLSQLGIQEKQASEKDRTTLGQEEFFRLMIAQMRNQNPLNPMDNTKFLGELAQFSNLASQQETQRTIEKLADSLISSQALQASSLVGRFVLVPGDTGYLPEGEGDRFFGGAVELEDSAANLVIDIYSESGQLVRSLPLGNQAAGLVRFTWDGRAADGSPLPAGNYRMVANAQSGGELQALPTLVVGAVESVTLGRPGQRSQVNVSGLGLVDINEVREIL